MRFTNRCLSAVDLVREIAQLLPKYVPGVETGVAEYTDKRSCWTQAMRSVFQAMARSRGIEMREPGAGEHDSDRQLRALWYDGDALLLTALSGWGERSESERGFANLMLLKSPQKVGHEAVIEQLTAALIRYPHHMKSVRHDVRSPAKWAARFTGSELSARSGLSFSLGPD
jgi:hypothetical protein